MKVAVVTNYWKNSDGGGVRTYLVNLFDALSTKNIDAYVIYREGSDPDQYFGGHNKFIFCLKSFLHLRKIRPDVIHTHGTWYCLFPSVIYKKLNKCKLIHTFHTEPVAKLSKISKLFFQILLDCCDEVTFVSKRLKTSIEEIDGLKFNKTSITYAGAQIKEVTRDEILSFRHRYSIKENNVVLMASGMTSLPYKAQGLKILFQSMVYLRNTYPNIVLIVTGKGKYYEELIKFSNDLGIVDIVVFTGKLDNPFIPLKICDIYTHITLGEGLPIALLEAMAMAKPIIATPIGGIPEAIVNGVNGILVEPKAELISEQLSYLIENKVHAENLGKNAESTIREKFTWAKSADHFLKIFTEHHQ